MTNRKDEECSGERSYGKYPTDVGDEVMEDFIL